MEQQEDLKYEKRGYLNSEFRLFHIIDDTQKEFSYHYHDFDKIVIMIRGNVSYTIEGQTYPLKPYDIVFVRHNEIHRPVIHSKEVYERIIIYISPGYISKYKTEDYDMGYCFERASAEHTSVLRIPTLQIHPLFKCIQTLEQSFHDTDYAAALYQQIIFLEFMIHLNRAMRSGTLDYLHNASSNSRILKIVQYINTHLTEVLSIEHIADTFFMSRYHMMRTFKKETGYSIGNYILQKRLALAKKLLSEGMPATLVCYQCGFKDYSNFSRHYKKFFQETPKEAK